jgi:pimeloyl-ACP methyl ester carboxylesterase
MTKLQSQRRDPNDDELGTLQKYVYPAQFFGQLSPEFREDWGRRSRISSMACQALMGEYMGGPQVPNRLDLRPKLPELKGVPTLIIAGEFDVVTPVQVVKTYADGIPGARFEIIENCGHYPYVEQHEQYIKLVKDFLSGQAAPSATGG